MPSNNMILSLGIHRNTITAAKNIRRITDTIIECDCPECGGDGDWGKLVQEPPDLCLAVTGSYPYVKGSCICIECKGTGRIYA